MWKTYKKLWKPIFTETNEWTWGMRLVWLLIGHMIPFLLIWFGIPWDDLQKWLSERALWQRTGIYVIASFILYKIVTLNLRKNPIGIGFAGSVIITTIAAIGFSQIVATPVAYLIAWLIDAENAFDWLVILAWSLFTTGISALLFLQPSALGQKRSEVDEQRMLPVPPNYAAIFTWANGRIKWLYAKEGCLFVPWWLLVGVSNAPVSKTRIEIHDAEGRTTGVEERDYVHRLEAFGYVFMERRTIQERVVVQSADTIVVTVDLDDIIQVINPITWQAADNPFGTAIGRLEAAIRIGVSNFKSRDVNLVRTLFPSLLKGCQIGFIKARKNKDNVRVGDLIRTADDSVIFCKSRPWEQIDDDMLTEFVETANTQAAEEFKPQDGFDANMVRRLTVFEERQKLLGEYGAIGKGTSIRDITLPRRIEVANEKVEVERAQRESELIEARTAQLTAEIYAETINDGNQEAAELALAERKGTVVLGLGSNPVAQLAALLSQPNQSGDA